MPNRHAGAPVPIAAGARIVLTLAALAVFMGVALLGPALADASNPRQFSLGVVGSRVNFGDTAQMERSGVQAHRLVFAWAEIETERPTGGDCDTGEYLGFDFYYDGFIAEQGGNDINLLPVIAGSPDYAADRQSYLPERSATFEYRCFVRELVERYGPGGSVLEEFPEAEPITNWQVSNEPNVEFYAGDVNPREYARVLRITADEIRSVDPNANIVLAGMPEVPANGMTSDRFLRKLYRVRGIESYFNTVAIHPYARNHRGVRGALGRLKTLLRRLGDARRPVWITEIGWADQGPRRQFPVVGARGQAQRLDRTFRMLRTRSVRRQYNLGHVYWFNWRDVPESEIVGRPGWHDFAGLYEREGRPKPACRKFVAFTGGRCARIRDEFRYEPTSTTAGPTGALPEVEVFAGQPRLIPSRPLE